MLSDLRDDVFMGYNQEDIKPKAPTRFKIESEDISDSEIDQVVPTSQCVEANKRAEDTDEENSLLDVDDVVVLYVN
jgi:hypothetical protein